MPEDMGVELLVAFHLLQMAIEIIITVKISIPIEE
jgi:hypothetical protein